MGSKLDVLLDRVRSWPAERQAEAEALLEALELQDMATPRLSDAQAAEVERRLIEPAPRLMNLAEVRARLANAKT